MTRGKSRFIQSEISCQNESVSEQTRSRCFWRLFNLHSQKFVEFPQIRKFAINHRQSSNRFIALYKPIKKYIQEEQSKKTWTKTRWDTRLEKARGKKSFKEGKYAVRLFRRQRVLPSKEMSESSKQTT